ncbi:MAG: DNA replication/repair protein RecF [Alphaproteobacteria bacterium]
MPAVAVSATKTWEASQPQSEAAPIPRLALSRLTVTNFRCYTWARIEIDARPVVLTGPNGAGKTNLLEAISFLAPGRGLRRVQLAEVARRGSVHEPYNANAAGDGSWAVAASLQAPLGETDIATGRSCDGEGRDRRTMRVDGAEVRNQAALAERVWLVWLTPQMDRLFLDGPSARRRFLDRLVYAFDPAHAGRVSAYEQAMRERARLLARDDAEEAWLTALETQMAERGVAIAVARRSMIAELAEILDKPLSASFPMVDLMVTGTVENWLMENPALAVEDRIRSALAASRRSDAEAGSTTLGPHRSDILVRDGGKNIEAAHCSTGEQKALLLSLILAHAQRVASHRGAAPILLLDEVVAHLDEVRRGALFEAICQLQAQAWMTGTDRDLFAALGDRAQRFAVAAAQVLPVAP